MKRASARFDRLTAPSSVEGWKVVALGLCVLFAFVGTGVAEEPGRTFVVPTHPRGLFRKDDLAELRRRCLTTHAAEYAVLKRGSDRAVFLGTKPVAPGLLYQMTGETRYLAYAESDYDAFHEVLDPDKARALANDILYEHRRRMSPDGVPYLGAEITRYMPTFEGRSAILTIFGDDVPLARPGELDVRLAALAKVFGESRQVYGVIAYRRGGKATTFHCACFFESGPKFFEQWRVATGEDYFGEALLAGSLLQPMHNTLPLEHHCAPLTNSWGHDHVGRPACYILASRARDGLCQWVIHNPAWATARDVGKPDPADFNALGHAWVDGTTKLGGYKEASWTVPVAWWAGHMPERILYYDPGVVEVPPGALPTSALFEGLGIVCMRSSWTDDAVFARLHSGPNFRGEPPHLNDNTFLLYHKGMLVRPERSAGVLTADANSVLVKDPDETIVVTGACGGLWPDAVWHGKAADLKPSKENDGGQSYWTDEIGKLNVRARGQITAYEASDLFTYAVGDATRSYNPAKLKQFTRQFLYLKPGLVLICDRVESTKAEFEKRWVLHTKGEARLAPDLGYVVVDAIETVKPVPTPGWDRTVGFGVPETEKAPRPKTTLRFETQWDGVEVGLVYDAQPTSGKVTWTFDDGKEKGVIDQHADEKKPLVESVLVRSIPKGKHVLELFWPDERINYAFFSVRLGGRLFVTTLLPGKFKREITANKDAQENPYSSRSDWRTDVVASEPRTDDVFLHVLEATDRSQTEPLAVERTIDEKWIVLRFKYRDRNCEVTFNRAGAVGGHVRIADPRGGNVVEKDLATGIVDTEDAHINRCREAIRRNPAYDYGVRDVAHLAPRAESADLLKALDDGRWYLRFYAVRALAAKRDSAAVARLTALLGDKEPRVAGAAAETLGRLGAKDAEAALIRALDSPAEEVRFHAAGALGELKSGPAVGPLVKLLSDRDDFVATSAAEALAKIGDPRSAAALVGAIDRGDKTHLKASYLWALVSIGGDEVRRRLETFKNGDDATLRACAVAGLVKLAGKDAAGMLRELRKDKDEEIRAFAARKLTALGDPSVLDEFVATAKDAEAKFPDRVGALDTLGTTGYKPATDDVATLLDDQTKHPYPYHKDSISTHAALALYRLGDERGIKSLESALLLGADAAKVHVARGAAAALGSVDRKLAVPILMKGLSVRRTQVAAEIAGALWRVTGEDPGADIETVGWRRADLDAKRWQEWWEKNKPNYP